MVTHAAPFELEALADAELSTFGLDSGWLTRIHMERRMSDALQLDTRLVVEEELAGEVLTAVVERTTRVRIAQACCSGNTLPDRDAVGRSFVENRTYLESERPDDSTLFYSAPGMDPDYCSGGAFYDEPEYGSDYACSVAGATASWSPLLLAMFITWRRKRRR
jgi:hypothetical protein